MQLVNADLTDLDGLRRHLAGRPWMAERARRSDLAALREGQTALGLVVDASNDGDEPAVVERINDLLNRHPIRPRISGHDATTWHLHVRDTDASVAEILMSESLFGLAILVTELGAGRLGRCAAAGCNRAFVDTSANQTRRFCSQRCATRTNVAAYRERQRQQPRPNPLLPPRRRGGVEGPDRAAGSGILGAESVSPVG